MPIKVTDPQKVVTDPVLLSHLVKHGIDKDYVELFQDYASRSLGKEHSPYAKFYRDLQSGKRFMVVSGLSMVDADGSKIEVGWRVAGINYFSEKNNLFRAKVQGTNIELTIRNDQPDGRKANDKLSYSPQLFLNGIEQTCGDPMLLPIDPVNSNYPENTLEWDFGICKRRLRIIEGSIHGSWVFASKPVSEVRIKYNQTGDYRLKLGQYATDNDTEVIPVSVFASAVYPLTVSDTVTYYPDADPETTSVDGYVCHDVAEGVAWATLRAAAGTFFNDDSFSYYYYFSFCHDTNLYQRIQRSIFLFNTAALPDICTISGATLSFYGTSKSSIGTAFVNSRTNIYSSAPASNIALAAGDFDSLGVTSFSTAIPYANWLTTAPFWNDFVLNASGLAVISKTGVTKLGVRDQYYDADGNAPTWAASNYHQAGGYFSEQGTGYKPKLVVTYTVSQTYNLSLSEGLTAGDALTVYKTCNVSISEGLTGCESLVPIKRMYPSLSEGQTVGDTLAILKRTYPSLNEGQTVGDTLAILKRTYPSLNEGLTLGDTLAVFNQIALSLSEGLTLGDIVVLVSVYNMAIVEGLSIGDALSITKMLQLSLGETLTAGDTLDILKTTYPSIAEGMTLGDALAVVRSTSPSISEVLSLTDSLFSQVNYHVSLDEGISLSDILAASLTLNLSVSEGLTFADALVIWLAIQYYIGASKLASRDVGGSKRS